MKFKLSERWKNKNYNFEHYDTFWKQESKNYKFIRNVIKNIPEKMLQLEKL